MSSEFLELRFADDLRLFLSVSVGSLESKKTFLWGTWFVFLFAFVLDLLKFESKVLALDL